MGRDLYETSDPARSLYDSAAGILGFDIADISFNGPEERLKQTMYTQPALYVHSYILSRLLREKGLTPDMAAGHSLGEYSAYACAGAFTFEEGLRLVRERGRLMQEAGERNPGGMAAIIGLSAQQVLKICAQASSAGIVQPANFNSPVQIVVSGSKEGVAEAVALAKEAGAKRALPLPVSGAFHSPLMEYAVAEFGGKLAETEIKKAGIPVYANVSARPAVSAEETAALLHDQLTHSVRWVETIEKMAADGMTRVIEVGAGKVLSGLVKRIVKDVEILSCGTADDLAAL